MLDRIEEVFTSDDMSEYYEILKELNISVYDENGTIKREKQISKELALKIVKIAKKYAFNNLIYQFKDCQNKSFYSDVQLYLDKYNVSQEEAQNKVREANERELKNFIYNLHEFY